jgi:Secretion system C-terminal sorting domain
MKKILLSGFFALIVLFTTAQCNIISGSTTQVGSPVDNLNGTTTYTFDLTFNLTDNRGNKFFNLDMWQLADYPALLDSTTRKLTCWDLLNSLVNISVNNNVTAPTQPTLLTTYPGLTCTPPVVVESAADGLIITKVYNPGGASYDNYTIQNITLTIPTGSSTLIKFFLWSSNAGSASVIHCSFVSSLKPEGGVLPVTISSFNAIRNNKNVSLIWETLGEHNAKGFEIQRKSGNGSWQTVAFVNSKAPGGQSSLTLSYSYSESNSSEGATFYRIRQLDFDSHGRYSEIRSVRGSGQTGKIIVYPNPSVDGKVNVLFDEANTSRSILLVDMNGRTMQNWNNYTANSLRIENLVAGFYRLQINNKETGEQSVLKVVVAK